MTTEWTTMEVKWANNLEHKNRPLQIWTIFEKGISTCRFAVDVGQKLCRVQVLQELVKLREVVAKRRHPGLASGPHTSYQTWVWTVRAWSGLPYLERLLLIDGLQRSKELESKMGCKRVKSGKDGQQKSKRWQRWAANE